MCLCYVYIMSVLNTKPKADDSSDLKVAASVSLRSYLKGEVSSTPHGNMIRRPVREKPLLYVLMTREPQRTQTKNPRVLYSSLYFFVYQYI